MFKTNQADSNLNTSDSKPNYPDNLANEVIDKLAAPMNIPYDRSAAVTGVIGDPMDKHASFGFESLVVDTFRLAPTLNYDSTNWILHTWGYSLRH